MLLAGIVSLLVATTILAEEPEGCGHISSQLIYRTRKSQPDQKRSKIIGGGMVFTGEVPWMARIDDVGSPGHCSGSLISGNRVLTAGHCFVEKIVGQRCVKKPRKITVCMNRFTNTDACPTEDTYEIEDEILHLDTYIEYNCDQAYDFVILKLKRETSIKPVCLPRPGNAVVSGHEVGEVFLLGFSQNHDDDSTPPLNTHLNILRYNETNSEWSNGYLFRTSYKNKTAGICGGDSGGPMLEIIGDRAVIVGVNINSNWDCIHNRLYPHKDRKNDFQFSVSLLSRLDDLSGTLFPTFG